MDETTVVSETNLDAAISFTKGCYVGQEIIVRRLSAVEDRLATGDKSARPEQEPAEVAP